MCTTKIKSPTPDEMFGALAKQGDPDIRVKRGSVRYSKERKVAVCKATGKPQAMPGGGLCHEASEAENAKFAAFVRHLAYQQLPDIRPLDEHEKSLVAETFEGDAWCGGYDGQAPHGAEARKQLFFEGLHRKTVLDDTTSGGSYASPDWFDSMLVTYPLLYGELAPYVNMVPAPRSSAVETVAVGNPTVTWGTAEGTALTPFDTTGLISHITATIFPVQVAVEIGLDLLSDSLPNLDAYLRQNVYQRFAAEVDKIIAVGDGTTQPTGLFTGSSVSVNSTNGTGGSFVYADMLNLYFGIGKQYRNPGNQSVRYVGSDNIYQQWRSIATGVTGDDRPLLGMDVAGYNVLDRPFSVQNDIPAGQVGFGDLSRYRLWRREGTQVFFETSGRTLRLANKALLLFRARFGGKLVDASAFADMANGSLS